MKRSFEEAIMNERLEDSDEGDECEDSHDSETTYEKLDDPWEALIEEGNFHIFNESKAVADTDHSVDLVDCNELFPGVKESRNASYSAPVTPSPLQLARTSMESRYFPQSKQSRYDPQSSPRPFTTYNRPLRPDVLTNGYHNVHVPHEQSGGPYSAMSRQRSFDYSITAWRAMQTQALHQQRCYQRHHRRHGTVHRSHIHQIPREMYYHEMPFTNFDYEEQYMMRMSPEPRHHLSKQQQQHHHHHHRHRGMVTPTKPRMRPSRTKVPTFYFPLPPNSRESFYNRNGPDDSNIY